MTDYERKQTKRLRQSKVILVVGVIFVIISPFVMTRSFGYVGFNETGQIGDTIGGITAPIVNLVGAVLVYYAFLVQLDANKLIFQQIKDQKEDQQLGQNRTYVFELYKHLKDELYSFSIQDEKKLGWSPNEQYLFVEYKGLEAINRMLVNLMSQHEAYGSDLYKLKEFLNIIELLKKFLVTLQNVELNPLDEKFFLEGVEYVYVSKIKASVEELVKPCKNCGKVHGGDPTKLNELTNEIEMAIEKIKRSL